MGKLTARERIDYLCDRETFEEIGQLAAPGTPTPEMYDWTRDDAPADGVIAGIGYIDSTPAGIIATDFTIKGGTIGETGAKKIKRIQRLAIRHGFPLVMLWDSGGHRMQEALDARHFAVGEWVPDGVFHLMVKASGWIPLVSAMMGPGYAGPANFAGVSDFVPMVEGTSTLGIAGPPLVNATFGLDLSKEEIGGSRFQTAETGMADIEYENDEQCLDGVRDFLSYLPGNARADLPRVDDFDPPYQESMEKLIDIIPSNTKKPFDVYRIIDGIVDRSSFFELKPRYAMNVITGFARVAGQSIGLIANNPQIKAGTIDVGASDKASRFISLCDAFGIPLVFLTDTPGVLPGPDSEREGIVRHSMKIPFEVMRATVPKINVVLRRGYGIAYASMAAGRATTNDLTVVWPTAEIAAMGIEGCVDLMYKERIESADDPRRKREEFIGDIRDRTTALRAAEHMAIDEVIAPRDTRKWIEEILAWAGGQGYVDEENTPPKKHGINPI